MVSKDPLITPSRLLIRVAMCRSDSSLDEGGGIVLSSI